MRFQGTRGGGFLSFRDTVSRGYPEGGGFFLPEAGVDLRGAVYAPAAGFSDVVALAASELLSESLDPRHASEIAQEAYGLEPGLHVLGEDILVLDLAGGPTGSSADYGAAFAARILGYRRDPAKEFVVAAASPREAAALASAFSSVPEGLPLVLLCEEGRGGGARRAATGGSPVVVLEVRGGSSAAAALERAIAGRELAGRQVLAAGAPTAVRLLGRSLLFIGLFSLARRGLSGDLIVAAPPGDLFGLVTGLWAWSWGLPVSAFLLPALTEGEGAQGQDDPEGKAGAEFLECFNRDYPLGSLVLRVSVPSAETGGEVLLDGLRLDRGSTLAARAAKAALAGGLAGHGKIVVPRFADESWDLAGEGEARRRAGRAADAVIDATPESLASAIAGLL